MSNRSRLVLGSLGGALAIHLAALACTSAGGGRAPVDASAADGGTPDSADGGLLDAVAVVVDAVGDVVRDIAVTLTDGEVRDAHAGGDAGPPPADAGVPGCACPAPPVNDFSFSLGYRTGGGPLVPRPDYSTASASATPTLRNNLPAVAVSANAAFFDSAGTQYRLQCSIAVRPDRTLVPDAPSSCSLSVTRADNQGASAARGVTGVTVTTLTDTRVEFRIPSIPDWALAPFPDAGVLTVSFTDVVFRATFPDGHLLTPAPAYRP